MHVITCMIINSSNNVYSTFNNNNRHLEYKILLTPIWTRGISI